MEKIEFVMHFITHCLGENTDFCTTGDSDQAQESEFQFVSTQTDFFMPILSLLN